MKGFIQKCMSDGKESACSAGDLGLIPGSGRSPGEGNGNLLQYSCLKNSMDRRGSWATYSNYCSRVKQLINFGPLRLLFPANRSSEPGSMKAGIRWSCITCNALDMRLGKDLPESPSWPGSFAS